MTFMDDGWLEGYEQMDLYYMQERILPGVRNMQL